MILYLSLKSHRVLKHANFNDFSIKGMKKQDMLTSFKRWSKPLSRADIHLLNDVMCHKKWQNLITFNAIFIMSKEGP